MAKSTSKKNLAAKADNKPASDLTNTATQPATAINSSLLELFTSELKDTYWAENHLVKSLPKMIAAAVSDDLSQALAEHLEITKTHVLRIEQSLELLGEQIVAKKCDAMEGLVMSGEHVIDNSAPGSEARETGIIMSGLKVEHFEITTYTGLIQTANKLGKTDIADLLQLTLAEESEAANILSGLAQATATQL